jgi:hypothetical protein
MTLLMVTGVCTRGTDAQERALIPRPPLLPNHTARKIERIPKFRFDSQWIINHVCLIWDESIKR